MFKSLEAEYIYQIAKESFIQSTISNRIINNSKTFFKTIFHS
ncbi:hypothetical protein EV06_0940 [Prochlorococcus sp. MIT 0602]|nr:hypothetical protein EV06_0940 [Prochlorococcus sp. MIT 0602]KGG17348.1 hypothetical protein EV07_0786 [Prochlorococcus sp. MIT 0603]